MTREAARASYVTAACAGDQPLAREVRSLMLAALRASALFEPPRVRR